ncbi:hypothetical protein [Nocardia brasiliensis]
MIYTGTGDKVIMPRIVAITAVLSLLEVPGQIGVYKVRCVHSTVGEQAPRAVVATIPTFPAAETGCAVVELAITRVDCGRWRRSSYVPAICS